MRGLIGGSIALVFAAMTVGCGSGGTKTDNHPMPTANTPAAGKTCTLQSGGKNVLSVMPSDNVTCTNKDGSLTLKSPGNQLDIWLVAGATSVDDAIAKVPDQINSEFKNFKSKSSTDMTVAGNPAKRMMGSGNEADDGDPGSAEVIVFKAGAHVFVACIHAEHVPADEPAWMTAIIGTAKAP